jgi:putative tryptophan/tyrosine transport system substrate-binding protein
MPHIQVSDHVRLPPTPRDDGVIRRRTLVAALGGMTRAWPVAVRAQQKAVPVIGLLLSGLTPWDFSPGPHPLNNSSVKKGLREAGYIDGKNVAFEYRWDENHLDRLPALAADLVSRRMDLIITASGTPGALAAKNTTSTIPIVFVFVGDPVGVGLVASLARPGGNVTGFSSITIDLMSKLFDLLSELVPQARTIGILVNPNNAITDHVITNMQEAARVNRVNLSVQKASTEGEIDAAFDSLVQLQVDALVVASDPFLADWGRLRRIAVLASRYAIPAASPELAFASVGGLICYGADNDDLLRQAGIYAGRILKGAKPADLPVQRPTTLKLVINLGTAKGLGLTVPQSILGRADEVIE